LGADVLAYNEHRQNLQHKDNRNGWNQFFRGGEADVRSVVAHNVHEADQIGRVQEGGAEQQDEYANTAIPYVDAKVPGALCKGGPVAYVVTDASGITNQWVLDYVAPSMRSATFCADP